MKKYFFTILTSVMALAAVIYFVMVAPLKQEPPKVLYPVSDFELLKSDGEKFLSQNELKDKIYVVNFIFTSCKAFCPTMSYTMAELYRTYEAMDDVKFVSITVDPKRDDGKTLTEYAKKFRKDSQKWYFLTGAWENIRKILVKEFKISAPEDPVFHSGKFVLVDQNQKVRGYYDYDDHKDMRQLFVDIAVIRDTKNEMKKD